MNVGDEPGLTGEHTFTATMAFTGTGRRNAGMSEKDAGRRKSITAADMTETVVTAMITADTEIAFSQF
jgi:hypothetical protein